MMILSVLKGKNTLCAHLSTKTENRGYKIAHFDQENYILVHFFAFLCHSLSFSLIILSLITPWLCLIRMMFLKWMEAKGNTWKILLLY